MADLEEARTLDQVTWSKMRREWDSNPRALWAKAFQVRKSLSSESRAVPLTWSYSLQSSVQSGRFGHSALEIMDRIMDRIGEEPQHHPRLLPASVAHRPGVG